MKNTSLLVTLTILVLLFLPLNTKAETQFSIAPSLLFLDYTEFSTGGTTLDKETGWIPGVQLSLNKHLNAMWAVGFELTTYGGNVDYNGQTQSGIAHSTTTDETLYMLGANIKTPLTTHADLIFGIKNNKWKRDINNNNGIFGLLEIYKWWEIAAGITSELWKTETQSWRAEASLFRTVNPTINVDLSRADYGTTDLNLGADWGGRLRLTWLHEHTQNWQYTFNIFYEAWSFGRSNSRTTTGGTNTATVYEPHSETQRAGLQLIITKSF